jgi:hypothetical protein
VARRLPDLPQFIRDEEWPPIAQALGCGQDDAQARASLDRCISEFWDRRSREGTLMPAAEIVKQLTKIHDLAWSLLKRTDRKSELHKAIGETRISASIARALVTPDEPGPKTQAIFHLIERLNHIFKKYNNNKPLKWTKATSPERNPRVFVSLIVEIATDGIQTGEGALKSFTNEKLQVEKPKRHNAGKRKAWRAKSYTWPD